MNLGVFIEIYGSSLPTNWHRTLSARYSALKPTHSKGQVIFKAIKVAGSKSREARRGRSAYGVQLTYDDTRLEEEYSKGNAWRGMKN